MIGLLTQEPIKRFHAKRLPKLDIIKGRREARKKELMKEMDKVLTINGIKYYREDLL